MSEEDNNNSFEGNTRLCSCCASCGIAEIDDIKLVPCDGCDLVKYCSDECLNNHKPEHEEACNKRAAELREELLFKQPEGNHWGDCPICSLPLPIDAERSTMMGCCSKTICDGCVYANGMRELEMRRPFSCPFCREPAPMTKEEYDKLMMKRIELNDPDALCFEGGERDNKGDYRSAFEYLTKATELGNTDAHWRLANMYLKGHGVEKDEGKEIHHLEEAAIGGHPNARYNLGRHELEKGTLERAMKHWIIAATQGYDDAIKALMGAFKSGLLEKEVLAAALRAQKAAVDETKSVQRTEADKNHRKNDIC